MQLYRLLTGPDDAEFCARVEKQLNKGWSLHGGPAAAFNGERVIVAQVIVREVEGDYQGFVNVDAMD
ncbi:MAG TPA: DUF1737 domain-containing protein [Sphingomicrobium sp.]|nr:DUF1737 domain-containing protein [Sphingomicrobium sp.]